MVRPAYDSPSLPIDWSRLEYCSGTNEMVEVDPAVKPEILKFYKENPEAAKEQFGEEPFELANILERWVRKPAAKEFHIIPTDTVYVTIDKEAVRKSGMLMASDSIPDKMVISLKGKRYLYKGDLMMLEIISKANWTRPIYVAYTVGAENYMNLGDNFVLEGLANRITPFTTNKNGAKNFDTEKTYNNLMNRYKYGGVNTPGIYLDETVRRMCATHRRLFGQLIKQLIAEGQNDKALKALQKCEKELPSCNLPYSYLNGGNDLAEAYALLGKKQEALRIINDEWQDAYEHANYYISLNGLDFSLSRRDIFTQMYIMNEIVKVTEIVDRKLSDKQYNLMQTLEELYYKKGGQPFEVE